MSRAARVLAFFAIAAASCSGQDAPARAQKQLDTPPRHEATPTEKAAMAGTTDPDTYRRQLNDPDEAVRAKAAIALHAMNDPGALEACIRTLDDAADPLHNDRTLAVQCLIEIGPPALPSLFTPLAASESLTRLHAQRAIEGITRRMQGFDGREWKTGTADDWIAWWEKMGYSYDAPPDNRAKAIERLRAWAAAH